MTRDPLDRSGRVSYMTPATTTPETKVSAAIAVIAKGMVNASARSPAAIAPMAYPESRQRRYTPPALARPSGGATSDTAARRGGETSAGPDPQSLAPAIPD